MSDVLAARVKRNKRFKILTNPDLNLAEITSEEIDEANDESHEYECELSQDDLPPDEDEESASPPDTDWEEESDIEFM